MELQIKIIGFLTIGLTLIHFALPKRFDWKNNLSGLNLFNRQMFKVHTFFIAFLELLMGILFITSADLIVQTDLGKRIALGLGIFWAVRFLFQFFVYSPELWRGKAFETIIHIVFSILWAYFTFIFFCVFFNFYF